MSSKFLARKITFQAEAFHSAAIQEQDGGRPQYVKAVEVRGRLFDVDSDRKEVLIDEISNLLIGV